MDWIRLSLLSTWIVPVMLSSGLLIILWKRNLYDRTQQMVFSYLAIALLFDLLTRFWPTQNSNNLAVVSLYAIGELLLITPLYQILLEGRNRRAALLLCAVGMLYLIWENLHVIPGIQSADMKVYQTYGRAVVAIITLVQGLWYALKSIRKPGSERLEYARLNAVFLTYYAFSFVVYLPINFWVSATTPWRYAFWTFNLLLLILFYAFLIFHLWRFGNNKRL